MLFFKKNEGDGLPNNLADIEKRLIEIVDEKPTRIYNLNESFSGDMTDHRDEEDAIAYLDTERDKLQIKRQFLLDRRNSWKMRFFWDILVPIFLSGVTAYLVSK